MQAGQISRMQQLMNMHVDLSKRSIDQVVTTNQSRFRYFTCSFLKILHHVDRPSEDTLGSQAQMQKNIVELQEQTKKVL